MPIHDHQPSFQGRAFLWGGIGLGVLFLAAIFTHGFGLLNGSGKGAEPSPLMVRQGDQILVPEGSALRNRLTVEPAAVQPLDPKLVLPAIVESDPARTANVLPALGGRVLELKVALGERVAQGQALAVIDSPDLAQAYDDKDKAADAVKLAEKMLARQLEQSKIGTASEQDLDQAKSNAAEAEAEYSRTQAHLKTLGVPADAKPSSRRLTVAAPVAGSITTLAVTPGTMINDPTQSIMTIADLTTVWVTAMVPEKDVAEGAVRVRCDRAGLAPQQAADRVRKCRSRAQAEHVRDGHGARGAALARRAAELGTVDEQRPNQRVRRRRSVDVRAPHRRSGPGRGHLDCHPIRRERRRSGRGERRNPAQ
jgi:multidrug efflux pump subunit AcrA (membrane-fusion protein)